MVVRRRLLAAVLLSSTGGSPLRGCRASTFLATHRCPLPPRAAAAAAARPGASSFLSIAGLGSLQHPKPPRLVTVRAMSEAPATTTAGPDPTSSSPSPEHIVANLEDVRARVAAACARADRPPDAVRLVAVSKTKPLADLLAAHDGGGQRAFGENYVQELVDKVRQFRELRGADAAAGVSWHFIGPLQSNKANVLVGAFEGDVGRLVVETVATEKLAGKLDAAVARTAAAADTDDGAARLAVYLQVNTSGEESKSGVAFDDTDGLLRLCRYVREECPRLALRGLMTIGAPGDDQAFDRLVACREAVAAALGLDAAGEDALELSMGMSDDFEAAIARGATNVRVGSTIFGARSYAK